jgi:hypothetical protein
MVQGTNPDFYDNSSKIAYVKKMYKFACFLFSLYIFYVHIGVIWMLESDVVLFEIPFSYILLSQ